MNQLKTAHVLPRGEAVRVDVSCKAVTTKRQKHHGNCEFQVVALNHLLYKTVTDVKLYTALTFERNFITSQLSIGKIRQNGNDNWTRIKD